MVSKEQRRRQLAREKFERQQQRRTRQRSKSRKRNVWIAGAVVVILAAGGAAWASTGLGDSSGPKADAAGATPTPSVTPSPSATGKPKPDPCAAPAAGSPTTKQWKTEPAMTIDAGKSYTLKLATTCGDIGLKLNAAKAPHTVNSFAFLAGQGFFDHTKCHRLTTANIYVLQCGDPKGNGSGGPGYTIPDENLKAFGKANAKGSVTYPAGTVAMANTGSAHSGGSQFFLVYKDSPLAPSYTPFGTIDATGMKVLAKIAKDGESTGAGDGAPNATVVINKATMTAS
ncbi:peptidylprolyl isomerase [Streptomyces sp. SL13]|uniref:Peptidylprolyl isomerase n=1 Tax=Streptantibioticus silvisoli TaxID=2705255 RepID=A0AA90KI26_9ACTN|nr:peptidylprolyl isomerase [Streptantibioticus silvisoli]MDI5964676.1 peptidylprolyl isomerase [Streptantibioticus silvisoli]MDI5972149.1 peptidylprolyl isomerase [Streptantibioticus silvisoli]